MLVQGPVVHPLQEQGPVKEHPREHQRLARLYVTPRGGTPTWGWGGVPQTPSMVATLQHSAGVFLFFRGPG